MSIRQALIQAARIEVRRAKRDATDSETLLKLVVQDRMVELVDSLPDNLQINIIDDRLSLTYHTYSIEDRRTVLAQVRKALGAPKAERNFAPWLSEEYWTVKKKLDSTYPIRELQVDVHCSILSPGCKIVETQEMTTIRSLDCSGEQSPLLEDGVEVVSSESV